MQREGLTWRNAYFMPAAADRWEGAASSALLCTAALHQHCCSHACDRQDAVMFHRWVCAAEAWCSCAAGWMRRRGEARSTARQLDRFMAPARSEPSGW